MLVRTLNRKLIILFRSKKRYTWKFNIDGSDYTIELFSSSLSGKKKVTLNGATRHETSS